MATPGGASTLVCSGQEHADSSVSRLISCAGIFAGLFGQRRFPLARRTLDFSMVTVDTRSSKVTSTASGSSLGVCAISAGGDGPNHKTLMAICFPLSSRRRTSQFLLIFSFFACLRDISAVSLPPNIQQLQFMTPAITIIINFNEK